MKIFQFLLPALLALPIMVPAAVISKANNADNLNLATSWLTNGSPAVPGPGDIAQWTNNLTTAAARTGTLGEDTVWSGIKIYNPGGLVTINTGNTLTLGGAALAIDMTSSARSLLLNCPVVLKTNNVWDNGATATTLTVAGGVSGNFSITKQGAGTGPLILSGVNTYAGDTIIAGGTLKLGASNAIPSGAGKGNVTLSGTLDLNAKGVTINGLSGGGIVDNLTSGAPTLTLGDDNQSSTFSGVIKNTAGTLALIKTGNGTVTLSGANAYSGSTTVAAGRLVVSSAQSGGGGFSVSDGGTLGVVRQAAVTSLIASSLTLGVGDGATNSFIFPNGNPAGEVMTVGALTLNGLNQVEILGTNFTAGRFPLIKYTSKTGGGTFAPVSSGDLVATVTDNAANGSIDLVISNGAPLPSLMLSVSPGTVAATNLNQTVTLSWTAANLPANSTYAITASQPVGFPLGGQSGPASEGTTSLPSVVNGRLGNTMFTLNIFNAVAQPVASASATVVSSITRPNVIVFLLDDTGWADFGCYGSVIQTPNIDALAADGLRYRQFHNTGRCSPTRCSVMTGNYTHAVANDPTRPMPTLNTGNNITIAELLGTGGPLGANGYRTFKAGKWHIGSATASRPLARGFDHAFGLGPYADDNGGTINAGPTFGHWVEGNYYMVSPGNAIPTRAYAPASQFHCTDAICDYAVDFINYSLVTNQDNRPLFAYLPFWASHWPISGPAALANHYTDVGNPNPGGAHPVRYEDGWDVIRQQTYERQLALGVIKPGTVLSPKLRSEWTAFISTWDRPADTQSRIVDWNTLDLPTRNDLARRAAVYAAAVEQVDQNVGKVVNRLKELGQFENTLIFILSDNGANSEGGQFGNGNPATANAASTYTPWDEADLPALGQSWAAYDTLGIPYNKYPNSTCVGGAWANVSNTPWRMYKRNEHNGGNLTACVVSWPAGLADSVKGTWSDERCHVIDIMATLADLTGVTRPVTFKGHGVLPVHGISLKPTFSGGKLPFRNLGFEHEKNRALFQCNWKLVTKNFAFSDGSSPAHELELYDMTTDPTELTNLASAEPMVLARLVDAWNAWALNAGVPDTTAYLLPTFVPPQFSPAPFQNDLLVDNFNRANATSLNASTNGMSGSRLLAGSPANVYYEGYEAAGLSSICVSNHGLRLCVGGGTSESGLQGNFIGSDITDAGGFSVQVRMDDLNAFTADTHCYAGFAVGLTQAQAAGGADIASAGSFRGDGVNRGVAPCFIELDYFGNVKFWTNGVLLASVPTGKNRGTLLASFATTSFAAGDSVTVTVFLDGQVVNLNPGSTEVTRTFTWQNSNANYLGLSARATAPVVSYVTLDNLAVRTWPLAYTLISDYALNAGINSPANAPTADPDADGNDNVVEWLHGGQPGVNDAARKLLLVGLTPQGEFRFNHFELINPAQFGVSYSFECSSNLVNWTAFTAEVTSTRPDVPGYELVERRVPPGIAAGNSSLFIRIIERVDSGAAPLPAGWETP